MLQHRPEVHRMLADERFADLQRDAASPRRRERRRRTGAGAFAGMAVLLRSALRRNPSPAPDPAYRST